ncbi:EPIDERMAL PATTERNING FACTOR-like protein 6 [Morus notabilis]|uniref:EPIDERMAL PATTERNING FACTOR-like protein 6 n=1 Tax=Morus notabilis TaxID=981085 RepID=UPI000CED772B|nr:EPIDERMAL PATTERNING FACTOR-like protein 6 [Morus notabilis]
MMKTRILCYILMVSLSWVSVTSRPFASRNDFSAQQDRVPHLPQNTFDSSEGVKKGIEGTSYGNEEELYSSLSRLGSRPPNCSHKCEGCYPCEPVQIPTTSDRVGVQIANYEPEGWKCKCENSFFNP